MTAKAVMTNPMKITIIVIMVQVKNRDVIMVVNVIVIPTTKVGDI